ncbi:MAG: 3-deoxy-manno-octulosonate cytidylyltransferase [Verrucomicrobiales bacterium]
MSAVAIIPARYQSTRFPGKPLALLGGKPMLQHVWERAKQALPRVIIATDDERIASAAQVFGAEVVMTSPEHPSGSDRIAEVIQNLPAPDDIVLNVQGDEPFVPPDLLQSLIRALSDSLVVDMATAACAMSADEAEDPNKVKVVMDEQQRALYFSRSKIPFVREALPGQIYYRHLGIYAYRRNFLLEYVKHLPNRLERLECLEQLRALGLGAKIQVVLTDDPGLGIDTPQDLEIAEKLLEQL